MMNRFTATAAEYGVDLDEVARRFEARAAEVARLTVPGVITVVCAWCGAGMGKKPGGTGVSHGICPRCVEGWRAGR